MSAKRGAYYNEIDPFAAAWLRELIKAGHIADGDVDERSIAVVEPADLAGYRQAHFFAGIGVWSYSLRLAGWPDDREIWTGSCPCQPFSAAGARGGTSDSRHLWPQFGWLIGECRPAVVIGEQVASKDGLAWLDIVCDEMEGEGYAFAAVDTSSALVGAPHIRQRLWWAGTRLGGLADDGDARRQGRLPGRQDAQRRDLDGHAGRGGADSGLADAAHADRRSGERREKEATGPDGIGGRRPSGGGTDSGLADAGRERGRASRSAPGTPQPGADLHDQRRGTNGGLADAGGDGRDGRLTHDGQGRHELHQQWRGTAGGLADAGGQRQQGQHPLLQPGQPRQAGAEAAGNGEADGLVNGGGPGPVNGFWANSDWLFCRDGRWRPVESGTFPLVASAAKELVRGSNSSAPFDADKSGEARIGRLRGYGNSINSIAAKVFIESLMEVVDAQA